MNISAGGIFSPMNTMVPSTMTVRAMLIQKFFGRRS